MKVFKKMLSVMVTGAFIWSIIPVSPVLAGELDSKMEKMVKRMVKTVHEKSPALDNATMAVFPFNTDEKLAKKKVDVAVSELMTQQLLKNSRFKLVERTQLEKILVEQKLGQSGAIDADTAAKVGKLLGARLAMLGSVSRFGKSYQITAKIVDTETAEILCLEGEEISVSVFDEEASRYLTLVPETQAIGVYLSVGAASLQVEDLPAVTIAGKTLTPLNPQSTYTELALGMKYYFYKNSWLADVSFTPMGTTYSQDDFAYSVSPPTLGVNGLPLGGSDLGGKRLVNGGALKVMVMHKLKIRDRWSGFLGGGIASIYCNNNAENMPKTIYDITDTGHTKPMTDMIEYGLSGNGYTTPMIRAGIEYRPQARFGIGLFGNYLLNKYECTVTQNIWGNSILYKTDIYKFSLPQISFEITTSLYF